MFLVFKNNQKKGEKIMKIKIETEEIWEDNLLIAVISVIGAVGIMLLLVLVASCFI